MPKMKNGKEDWLDEHLLLCMRQKEKRDAVLLGWKNIGTGALGAKKNKSRNGTLGEGSKS